MSETENTAPVGEETDGVDVAAQATDDLGDYFDNTEELGLEPVDADGHFPGMDHDPDELDDPDDVKEEPEEEVVPAAEEETPTSEETADDPIEETQEGEESKVEGEGEIIETPCDHYGVVEQNAKRGEYRHPPTDELPALVHFVERQRCRSALAVPQAVFQNHQRYSSHQQGDEIGNEKRSSPVFVRLETKPPDVSQSDRRPYRRHKESHAAAPQRPFNLVVAH